MSELAPSPEDAATLAAAAALVRRLRGALQAQVCDVTAGERAGIALYTLSDPRDVRAVRYVGQTGAPLRRYRQHVRAACLWLSAAGPWWVRAPHLVPLHGWIRALHADGGRLPFMLVHQWVPTLAEALALEQSLIDTHRAAGCLLLNCEALRVRAPRARRARSKRHLTAGAHVGELSPEVENHGRVVHPDDHHDQ
jgi:hypothetical protein